jgi:hypothetical protein
MFKKVTKMLLTIALTGWMGVANATLIFDFSLNSNDGKFSGEILGLLDNVDDQSASSVTVTDIYGNTVGWVAGSSDVPLINIFDVSDGELVNTGFIVNGDFGFMQFSYDIVD